MEESIGEIKVKVYKISDAEMTLKLTLKGEQTVEVMIETNMIQTEIMATNAPRLQILENLVGSGKFDDQVFHFDSFATGDNSGKHNNPNILNTGNTPFSQ